MVSDVHACGLEYSSGKIASDERRGGMNIQKRSFTSAEAPSKRPTFKTASRPFSGTRADLQYSPLSGAPHRA
jgi:hypothetical protein